MNERLATSMLILTVAACSPPPDDGPEPDPRWLDLRAPDEQPPGQLSEVGLYRDVTDRTELHPDAVAYEPVWPLWSNGLSKSRFLVLPAGETITTGDVWSFPEGTLLFKTFEDDDGPVETRLMWRGPEGWEWSVYDWNDDATEAERTGGRRSVEVDVTVDGESLTHRIPNELDCRKCHEPDGNGVLGFEPMQLTDDVAAMELFDAAPQLQRVDHEDEATAEILGWFVGNCTSCHNGSTEHDQASFDLRPDVALENTIGVETASSASIDGTRIVPGDPAQSVLFLAVSGESDDPELKLMPPAGVQRRDDAAVEALRSWIEELQ
jgi:hypothetical protein